jgi:NAD(P)-dependent dehydrogenase (short-subunit alcohol dehydrogenase family)
MPRPLSEQVVVVVGASSGFGLLTAQRAAARGASVVLAARNAADLDVAVRDITRAGGSAIAVPTDVTDYEQVQRLAQRAVAEFGRIDTWINNAAVSLYGYFMELSLEDIRRVMDVNFMGQVHGARAALPHLDRTDGALICVGSALSDRGVPLQTAYCAAKHALKGLLDGLRIELRRQGSHVRVTLIKPSSINTPLFNKARSHMGVMPKPIPPIYDPVLAADALLRAAEGDERDIYVGGAGKLFSVAERINPRVLDAQQLRSGFAAQKTSWPKTLDAPNNLYAPVEHDGGVRGDFLIEATDHSAFQSVDTHARRAWLAAAGLVGAALALWLTRTSVRSVRMP